MKCADISPTEEIFIHEAEDGTQTVYAVERLYQHALAHPLGQKVRMPVEAHHAQYLVEHRGIERDQIEALMGHADWLAKPILFIEREGQHENSHILVDGTHRYVLFFHLGLPEILAIIVPEAVARAFVVEDSPTLTREQLYSPPQMAAIRALLDRRGQV